MANMNLAEFRAGRKSKLKPRKPPHARCAAWELFDYGGKDHAKCLVPECTGEPKVKFNGNITVSASSQLSAQFYLTVCAHA